MNQTEKKLMSIGVLALVGIGIIIYLLLTAKAVNLTPSGSNDGGVGGTYVLSCSNGGDTTCTTTCTRPIYNPPITTTVPTDGSTCRNYATKQGYSGSAFQIDINSITSCQAYVYSHACSVPTKVDLSGNCCMWLC